MNNIKLLLLLIAVLLFAACGSTTAPVNNSASAKPAEPAKTEPAKTETAHKAAHWTYKGEEGPQKWGEIDPTYATCSSGKSQSPIDIVRAEYKDLPNIAFSYQPSKLKIINNGHTVQVNYDAGSSIEIGGQRYIVSQFHYHSPSEHTVNGKTLDAELHVVHTNAEGKLAVVGILLSKGQENAAYKSLLASFPATAGPEQDTGITLNVADLLPKVRAYYGYSGSLTTPPCTEGVSWYVMTTPVEISADQIAAFHKAFEGNNRPVQPLNTRPLTRDSTP